MALTIVLSCIAGLLGLAVLAVAIGRWPAGVRAIYGACLAVSLISLTASFGALIHAPAIAPAVTLPLGLPWLGAHFRLDALSAFFLVVVNLGAAAASLFALGYGQHETAPQRVLPFYPAFLAGMNLVVLADDAFTFLIAWEFMSLTSWALVMAHHRDPEQRARRLRLSGHGELRHAGAAARLRLARRARRRLRVRRDPRSAIPLPGLPRWSSFSPSLGAGSKAGLVPLHVWLPLAHPAAPSHVSALMSGVMTKVAVYGFVRIVFDLLGPPAWWWSIVVLALGGVTAMMGVLYALMQHDLKRLLAYHTVENIGIIFIGLGLALAFKAYGMAFAAALALTAALLHVFNHSLFKSLLFFGAGAVLTATGERDMEHLGGLIHRMPQTAFVFLVGCAAISALPPLNGFVSEWLTFQAILLSPQLPSWGLKFLVPAVGALLALSAALAAACFVKAYRHDISRPPAARRLPRRAMKPTGSRSPRCSCWRRCACLPAFCPAFSSTRWRRSVSGLVGDRMPVQIGIAMALDRPDRRRAAAPTMACWCFVFMIDVGHARGLRRFIASPRHDCAAAPAWDCGYPDASPATQYTAIELRPADPPRVRHRRVSGPRDTPRCRRPATCARRGFDGRAARSRSGRQFMRRIAAGVGFAAERLNRLQFLTIRQFLSLVFGCRGHSCFWCSRYGPDPRLRPSGRADAAGAVAGAAVHRLRAQSESAAVAAAGPAAHAALSRSGAAHAQGGGAGGQRLVAVSRRFPISSSPPPGLRLRWCRPFAPVCCSPGRPISSPSSRCSAAHASSLRLPGSTSAPASAASARAAR